MMGEVQLLVDRALLWCEPYGMAEWVAQVQVDARHYLSLKGDGDAQQGAAGSCTSWRMQPAYGRYMLAPGYLAMPSRVT